jgi:rfaE bifunctional protein kinase chain/domain
MPDSMDLVNSLFNRFGSLKVGVIGDVMLDTYMWGETDRISPEAPVPIVSLKKKEYRIGGAGNVALNLQSLGAKAFVLSVTGTDEEGDRLGRLFEEQGIDTAYSIRTDGRITTNKIRVISRNQQMMRLDAELTTDLPPAIQKEVIKSFEHFLRDQRPDVVILEDYNKGVLTEVTIREVISRCQAAGVLTAVDPKRKNFFSYKGVDIFKPNLKEVREAMNMLFSEASLTLLQTIHSELHHLLHHRVSLITLSEKGVFFQDGDSSGILPSHLRNIADVSGAGDTVIAVAALTYAATRNTALMAEVANIAGGLVCEEVGTAAIRKEKLLHECQLLLS